MWNLVIRQAVTKDLTSSSKFSGSSVLTLQTHHMCDRTTVPNIQEYMVVRNVSHTWTVCYTSFWRPFQEKLWQAVSVSCLVSNRSFSLGRYELMNTPSHSLLTHKHVSTHHWPAHTQQQPDVCFTWAACVSALWPRDSLTWRCVHGLWASNGVNFMSWSRHLPVELACEREQTLHAAHSGCGTGFVYENEKRWQLWC